MKSQKITNKKTLDNVLKVVYNDGESKGDNMLTAEIKINGELVAEVEAVNVKMISDKPGDFINDRATVCEYKCTVREIKRNTPDMIDVKFAPFTVINDRRFGWQGLLGKITEKITPTVVETINENT